MGKEVLVNPHPEYISDNQWDELQLNKNIKVKNSIIREITERKEGTAPEGPTMVLLPEANFPEGREGPAETTMNRQVLTKDDPFKQGEAFRRYFVRTGRGVLETDDTYSNWDVYENELNKMKTYLRTNHPSWGRDFVDEVEQAVGFSGSNEGNYYLGNKAQYTYDKIVNKLEERGLVTVNKETGDVSSKDKILNSFFEGRTDASGEHWFRKGLKISKEHLVKSSSKEASSEYWRNMSADQIIQQWEGRGWTRPNLPEGLKQIIRENKELLTDFDTPLNINDLNISISDYVGEESQTPTKFDEEFVSQADWYTNFMAGKKTFSTISKEDFGQVLEKESPELYKDWKSGLINKEQLGFLLKKENSSIGIGEGRQNYWQNVQSPVTADVDVYPVYGEKQMKLVTDILGKLYKGQDIDVGIMGHHDSRGNYFGMKPDKIEGSVSKGFKEGVNVGDCYMGVCYPGKEENYMSIIARAFDATTTIGQLKAKFGTGGKDPYRDRPKELGGAIDSTEQFIDTFFQSGAEIISVPGEEKK